MTDPFADLVRPDRYPRASQYDPAWVVSLEMGPHPLWQLEQLLPDLALEPGMRVLDLGSGRGGTSVFLARECGAEVVACDLWVPAAQAQRTFDDAGVSDRVTAVNADVRALPFDDGSFDAVVSVDAFEYFGTDVHLLGRVVKVLRAGGRVAMSTPALRTDPYDVAPPRAVTDVVGGEAAAWHPPDWWRRHWELSGEVRDVRARWQDDGYADWLCWSRVVDGADAKVTRMLEDVGDELGFALVSATAA